MKPFAPEDDPSTEQGRRAGTVDYAAIRRLAIEVLVKEGFSEDVVSFKVYENLRVYDSRPADAFEQFVNLVRADLIRALENT